MQRLWPCCRMSSKEISHRCAVQCRLGGPDERQRHQSEIHSVPLSFPVRLPTVSYATSYISSGNNSFAPPWEWASTNILGKSHPSTNNTNPSMTCFRLRTTGPGQDHQGFEAAQNNYANTLVLPHFNAVPSKGALRQMVAREVLEITDGTSMTTLYSEASGATSSGSAVDPAAICPPDNRSDLGRLGPTV